MSNELSVSDLWESVPSAENVFQAANLSHLPDAVQRYLEQAIAPGTRLAQAVRLQMHGEIKLKRWLPFKAEEVIAWNRGFIWSATVRMFGMPIRGSDRYVDGEGSMRWRLFGIYPGHVRIGARYHAICGRSCRSWGCLVAVRVFRR